MTDIKMAEDRPRDIHYKDGVYDVSLIFGWLDSGKAPSGLRVHVAETAKPTNFAQSTGSIQKTWSTFEEATEEGKRFAAVLINTWPKRKENPEIEAG